ncbi:hypothetical protein FAI40_04685 [Acetobacteraceae bacterium]|nr:hypothetical protein FAI40_04685 [Acetobacteraceae bacterium]
MYNTNDTIETNVQQPLLTEAGFTSPSQEEILQAVQADLNQAFGGNVNPALNTPQGQLARSQTAILSDFFDALLEVFNGIDPAFASGRMQDALGRIYFLTRKPETATIAEVELTLTGTNLPLLKAGTILATDSVSNGHLYALLEDFSVPANTPSPITTTLACLTKGAVECPANSLLLYQGNLGIASLNNPSAGVTGQEAEGRIDFENRRANSVASQSMGQNAALLGALLSLDGVEDAQVIDNAANATQTISGVTLQPHSLYAVLVGGSAEEIGKAFLAKKPPGCATNGSEKVTVTEENAAYGDHPPSYVFFFDYATPVNLYLKVVLASLKNVPSNANELVVKAIINYFKAPETRPKLGATLYSSDLIVSLRETYPWARILSLSLGVTAEAGQSELTLPLGQIAVTDANFISVILQ